MAGSLSLYKSGVIGLTVRGWPCCTSISSVVLFCSAPPTADGSPFLCALLLVQALLFFWASCVLFFYTSVSSTLYCIFQCATCLEWWIPIMWHHAKNWLQSLYRQVSLYARVTFLKSFTNRKQNSRTQIKNIVLCRMLCYTVTLCKIGNHAVIHSQGY